MQKNSNERADVIFIIPLFAELDASDKKNAAFVKFIVTLNKQREVY